MENTLKGVQGTKYWVNVNITFAIHGQMKKKAITIWKHPANSYRYLRLLHQLRSVKQRMHLCWLVLFNGISNSGWRLLWMCMCKKQANREHHDEKDK